MLRHCVQVLIWFFNSHPCRLFTMPADQQLIKDFLGGDPIAGWNALCELLSQGDDAEEALFARKIDHKTVQQRRRWLRYVAVRESSVRARLLERLKGGPPYYDPFPISFLFSGLQQSRAVDGELYKRIRSSIQALDPGAADATMMAYGQTGGDSASIWYLVTENHLAWDKLHTFAFRSACVSCARINAGSLWALENLVTHFWNDFVGLEKIANSPDANIPNSAIDSAEIHYEPTHQFTLWRRGEVADIVLRDFSQHEHWRVRWLGAEMLANLALQRTARLERQWLEREQHGDVRDALMDALQRTQTTFGADALLDTYEVKQKGAAYLAKTGWLASDRERAIKALNKIAGDDENYSADALVSLARLGSRYSGLDQFLDSRHSYFRLNAMLALGYLKEVQYLPNLTRMLNEAASAMERIYAASASALLGKPGSAAVLNRELINGAAKPNYSDRVDVFLVHQHLKDAVLAGLESGGQESKLMLDAWRAEMEPLDPIQDPTQPSPMRVAAVQNEPEVVPQVPGGGEPGAPQYSSSPPELKSGPQKNEGDPADETREPRGDDQGNNRSGSEDENRADKSERHLLVQLTRLAGVGGLGLGIFYLLLKPLHIEALDSAAAKLFMLIVYGVAVIALIVWAAKDRKNNVLAGILAAVAVVISLLGWSIGRGQNHGDEYVVTIDVLKPDGTQATTNEATVAALGTQVWSNQDGKSWTVRLNPEDKGHPVNLVAEIKGEGLHATDQFTPGDDHQPAVHLKLVPGGSVDFTVLVLDEKGATAPDAIAFEVGGKSGATDVNGETTLSTNEPLGKTITLRARRGQDEVAVKDDYHVGDGAATLNLQHVGKAAAAKASQPAAPLPRSQNGGQTAVALKSGAESPATAPASAAPQVNQTQTQQTTIVVNNPAAPVASPVANLTLRMDSVRLQAWFEAAPGGNHGAWPTSVSLKVDDQVISLPIGFSSYKNKPNQISMDSLSKVFELTKGNHTFGCTVTIDLLQNRFEQKHRSVTAAELESFTLDAETEVNPFVTLSNTKITQCQLLKPGDKIPERIF